jgi:DNA-binding transcriptional ArsR family regulator
MSAPAMSRHLRVLRAGGLVEAESGDDDARLRVYRLRPERFVALQAWLDQVQAFWGEQLGAFKAHAERTRRGKRA